jgi:hypothetical protein
MSRALFLFLYVEAVVNTGSGLYAILAPAPFLAQLAAGEPPRAAIDLARWFGVVVLAMGYVQLKALRRFERAPLRAVLEGLLLGDVVYLPCLVAFVNGAGGWTPGSAFSAAITVAVAFARAYFVLRPGELPARPAPSPAAP